MHSLSRFSVTIPRDPVVILLIELQLCRYTFVSAGDVEDDGGRGEEIDVGQAERGWE